VEKNYTDLEKIEGVLRNDRGGKKTDLKELEEVLATLKII
jgi:hypothetical protein